MEIIQGFQRALGKIKNLNFALKANLHVKVKTLKLQQEQYGIFHRSTRSQFDRGEKTWIHGRSPLFATGQNVFREPSLRNRVETSFDISESNSTKNRGKLDNPTIQNLPGEQVARGSSRLNASEFLEFLDPISFYSSPLLCRRSPKSSLDSWLHKNVLKRQQDTSHNH